MPFNNPVESEAFYALETDRAKAIMYGVMIENRLTDIIKLIMIEDAAVWNELFQPSGPLGNFGTKIRIAYMLKVLPEQYYRDLLTINRIRNLFAHDLTVKNFADKGVTQLINSLSMIQILEATRDKEINPENRVERILKHILENNLTDAEGRYKECTRLYMHWLEDYLGRVVLARMNSDGTHTSS